MKKSIILLALILWIITFPFLGNSQCTVSITSNPTNNIVCLGSSVTLKAHSSSCSVTNYTWSVAGVTIASGPTIDSIQLVVFLTATYKVVVIGSTWSDSITKTIIVNQNPTPANAGPDQNLCGLTSTTLAGNNPIVGYGHWTIATGSGKGGYYSDIYSPTATFTGVAGNSYNLVWSISTISCGISKDTIVIHFNANPTIANAGPDQNLCGVTSTTLNANSPTIGTGSWNLISGTGDSIFSPNDPHSGFKGILGQTYILRWTISNSPCQSFQDTVVIHFNANPTVANAGPDQTDFKTCGLTSIILSANIPLVGISHWTSLNGGTFSDTNSPTSVFSGTPGIVYNLVWNIFTVTCGMSKDTVRIELNAIPNPPTLTGGSRCDSGYVKLTGVVQTYCTINWYDNVTGGTSLCSGSKTYTPWVTNTKTFYAEAYSMANCASVVRTPVTATINPLPTPIISGNDTVCLQSAEIYSVPYDSCSSYNWVISGGNIISGQGTDSILVKWNNTGNGKITITETSTFTCVGTKIMNVVIHPLPMVSFSPATITIPEGTSTKLSPVTNGTSFSWSPTTGLDNPTIKNPTAKPMTNQFYNLTVTNSYGCQATDSVKIFLSKNIKADFGHQNNPDLTTVRFSDKSAPSGIIAQWHWDFGDGDTSNLQSPVHKFSYPRVVTVKLMVISMAGYKDSITKTFHTAAPNDISEQTKPTIKIYPNPSNGVFTVESDKPVNIEIFDLHGQILISTTKIQNQQINISVFSKGIYLMRITDGISVKTERIIIR